jgi:hypothetical protein
MCHVKFLGQTGIRTEHDGVFHSSQCYHPAHHLPHDPVKPEVYCQQKGAEFGRFVCGFTHAPSWNEDHSRTKNICSHEHSSSGIIRHVYF